MSGEGGTDGAMAAILVDILTKVSGVAVTVARVEENTKNQGGRLDAHDHELREMRSLLGDHGQSIQKLALDAEGSAATAIALADALEKAESARRSKTEDKWTPINRFYLIVSIAVALATVYYLARPHG